MTAASLTEGTAVEVEYNFDINTVSAAKFEVRDIFLRLKITGK